MADTFISCTQLLQLLGWPHAPLILDVRTPDDARRDPTRLPTARSLSLSDLEASDGSAGGRAVVYCQRGGKLSQLGAAVLRKKGVEAVALTGGHLAWQAQGLATMSSKPLPKRWIMAQEALWPDLAALWVLRRWIDPRADVLAVSRDQIDAACQVGQGQPLPGLAQAMADVAGLSLVPMPPAEAPGLSLLLAGRLQRMRDPVDALDLVDDLMAGRRGAA
ncbi:MAG: rhodanese-like domain-containing protein [Pseudomonadota bacterium]